MKIKTGAEVMVVALLVAALLSVIDTTNRKGPPEAPHVTVRPLPESD